MIARHRIDEQRRFPLAKLGEEAIERSVAATKRAEDLDPWPERRCALNLRAAAPRERESTCPPRNFLREARLSDPGFADQRVEATVATGSLVEAALHRF